jgi:hypothetical protein
LPPETKVPKRLRKISADHCRDMTHVAPIPRVLLAQSLRSSIMTPEFEFPNSLIGREQFPVRQFHFPVLLRKIPCSTAQGILLQIIGITRDCRRRHVWRHVLDVRRVHGLLAVRRHEDLHRFVVIADGATVPCSLAAAMSRSVWYAEKSWTNGIQPRCLSSSSFIDPKITNHHPP